MAVRELGTFEAPVRLWVVALASVAERQRHLISNQVQAGSTPVTCSYETKAKV